MSPLGSHTLKLSSSEQKIVRYHVSERMPLDLPYVEMTSNFYVCLLVIYPAFWYKKILTLVLVSMESLMEWMGVSFLNRI